MIARYWRGLAKAKCADDYVTHLRLETFPALETLDGFINASILRRTIPEGVEFLIVTRWKSIEAIHAFARDDISYAVVPPNVIEMMIEYDSQVRHYEIVE